MPKKGHFLKEKTDDMVYRAMMTQNQKKKKTVRVIEIVPWISASPPISKVLLILLVTFNKVARELAAGQYFVVYSLWLWVELLFAWAIHTKILPSSQFSSDIQHLNDLIQIMQVFFQVIITKSNRTTSPKKLITHFSWTPAMLMIYYYY